MQRQSPGKIILRSSLKDKVKAFRKEERIKEILKERGSHPGLMHIFSAMETCTSYKPWHDKTTGKTSLKYDSGKCLHYYFYFIDKEYGLCYLRVPTWCPHQAVLLQRTQPACCKTIPARYQLRNEGECLLKN